MPKQYTEEYMRDRIAWARETLIPDLKDSGMDATAEDFEMFTDMLGQMLGQTIGARAASSGDDAPEETQEGILARINAADARLHQVNERGREAMRLYDRSGDGSVGKQRARRMLDEVSTQRNAIENELSDLADKLED